MNYCKDIILHIKIPTQKMYRTQWRTQIFTEVKNWVGDL